MKIIVCVDNQNGMMFNHRRQSQDRVLRKRILELTGGKKLWMNAYSQKQFLQVNGNMSKEQEQSGQIQADEAFLEKAGPGEYCFVEDKDVVPYESRIEEVILCHWNRDYPADVFFEVDLSKWRLEERKDFSGYSHEKITKEIYNRQGLL
jgi:hypothetical protein